MSKFAVYMLMLVWSFLCPVIDDSISAPITGGSRAQSNVSLPRRGIFAYSGSCNLVEPFVSQPVHQLDVHPQIPSYYPTPSKHLLPFHAVPTQPNLAQERVFIVPSTHFGSFRSLCSSFRLFCLPCMPMYNSPSAIRVQIA